jgi:RHS repeat-associated protein
MKNSYTILGAYLREKQLKLTVTSFLFFLLAAFNTVSATIYGESTACSGSTKSYWTDVYADNYSWSVSGGTIVANYGDYIDVYWTGTGSGYITLTTSTFGTDPCKFCIESNEQTFQDESLTSYGEQGYDEFYVNLSGGSAGTTSVTPTTICKGGSVDVKLSGQSGPVIRWEKLEGGVWTHIAKTTSDIKVEGINQNMSFRAYVQTLCGNKYSSTVSITVQPPSVGGYASGPYEVVEEQNEGTISLSGQTGQVVNWEASADGINWYNYGFNGYTSFSFYNLEATTYFRAIIKSGSCAPAYSSSVKVTVVPLINGPTEVCIDKIYSYGCNAAYNTFQWSIVGGVLVDGYGNTLYPSTSSSAAFVRVRWDVNATQRTISLNASNSQSSDGGTIQEPGYATYDGGQIGNLSIAVQAPIIGQLTTTAASVCKGGSSTINLTGQNTQVEAWQTSADGINWNTILEHKAETYTLNNIQNNVWVRVILDGGMCDDVYTNTVFIRKWDPVVQGTMTGGTTVTFGANAGSVQLENYQGTISYWEKSDNGGENWTKLYNGGSASITYENLTATTLYRAFLSGGPCGGDTYTSIIVVLVERQLNWVHTRSYNESEELVGESRTYSDAMGREVQSLSKSMSKGQILATQPLYNREGEVAGQTLAAPVGTAFSYKEDFLSSGGTPYHYSHFDGIKTDNPAPVDMAYPNTLGWYYSTNNTLEPFTPVSAYPYTMTTVESIGGLSRSALPGDELRMGKQHESISKSFPVTTELDHYLSLRQHFVTETTTPITLKLNAIKQVGVDQNGRQAVSFADKDGNVLATCIVKEDGEGQVPVMITASLASGVNANLNFMDVHLPATSASNPTNLNLSGNGTVRIYDLMSGNVAYEGAPANVVLAKGFYRVQSVTGEQNLSHKVFYGEFSYNYYDDAGRLVATVAPKGVNLGSTTVPAYVSRFTYSSTGQLLETDSPDEGRTRYVYRKDGQIRFSQNARQSAQDKYSYTHYDRAGRLIEAGEYTMAADRTQGVIFENHFTATPATNSVLQTSILESTLPGGGLDAGRCSQRMFNFYDEPDPVPSNEYVLTGRKQQFTVGALSKTSNDNSTTWYSYDENGRPTWTVQQINGLGLKTLDYSYDKNGSVAKVVYQKGATDEFIHEYTYDPDGRLEYVYTTRQGVKTLQAKYSYYLHGPLKRVELAEGLQGVDYTYTVQGWLKSINHSNGEMDPGKDGISNTISRDLFGMTLQYHPNDYASRNLGNWALQNTNVTSLYNGMITANAWQTSRLLTPQAYAYTYDAKYQLQKATHGTLAISGASMVFTGTGKNKEEVPGYDAHGNIDKMIRTDANGNNSANYKYNYLTGTNKLASITPISNPTGASILSYEYDELGQMTRETEAGKGEKFLEYDVTGKVKAVYTDANKTKPLVRYYYDERGQRIRKVSYGVDANNLPVTSTAWYVTDAAGNLQSLYKVTPTLELKLEETPVYGAARIGMLSKRPDNSGREYLYELSDHLGNVRAVFRNPDQEMMLASMEPDAAAQEEENFDHLNETRQINQTYARTGQGSARLHARSGRSYGPSRMVAVQPGDSVSMKGWFSFRPEQEKRGSIRIIPYLIPGEGVRSAGDQPKGLGRALGKLQLGFLVLPKLKKKIQPEGMPVAHMQVSFFDKDSVYISGSRRLMSRMAQDNWEEVTVGAVAPEEAAFAMMAVQQEGGEAVYVDDVTVSQSGGILVEEKHLYPFGQELINMGYSDGTHYRYRYGYQGQYAERDSETGWESFELRMYDSRIGRWLSIDPYGQYYSPYVGMGNNPGNMVDPDGGLSNFAAFSIGFGIGAIGTGIAIADSDMPNWKKGLISVAGGIAGGASVVGLNSIGNLNISMPPLSSNLGALAVGALARGVNSFFSYQAKSSGLLFTNETRAYNYMWNNSFNPAGEATVEMSAWFTNKGVLVAPPIGNDAGQAWLIRQLPPIKVGDRYFVKHGKLRLEILGLIHTHPDTKKKSSGLSGNDMVYRKFGPVFAIEHKNLYFTDKGVHSVIYNGRLPLLNGEILLRPVLHQYK